jgi:periplasmic divalent cation tolerance protein
MTKYVVGMVTCSSRAEARKIAGAILSKRLAACVNIVGGLESHYWWRGNLERASEHLLLIKTTRARIEAVTNTVKAAHSYQTPEIIFLPVTGGDRRYLRWISGTVSKLSALFVLVAGVAAARADQIDDWIRQLGHADEEIRAEAAEKLAEAGGPRAQRQFREMLASPNPELRQIGVAGLLQVSDEDADVERVRSRLKDESSTVRWSAALALGQSGRAEAIPWLEQIAGSDGSESVREVATDALTRLRSCISWTIHLNAGLKLARELRKPVLAYFFVRGSEFCRRLEEGVFSDQAVVDAAQEFVCVRIDAGNDDAEARRYDVRGAPTILILDGDGNEMARVPGLVDKATLLAKLAESRRGRLTFREARRQALRNPADVQANWKVAETYLEEGRSEQAEPHLRNVIAHDAENRYGYTDNAMFALGFALGKRGEHAQAVYSFEHLLARWPDFKDKDKALYCLGLSELATGQMKKARATLEQLIREFPESSVVKSAWLALEKSKANERHDETSD